MPESTPIETRKIARDRLTELASLDERIFCIDSDVGGISGGFGAKIPNRYFDVGIAESALVSTAAGIAHCGGIPFINSFATFASGRAFEQLKIDVCYHNLPVKILATHAGLAATHLGPTHHATEDIGIMRCLPNMSIFVPADANDAVTAVDTAVDIPGPVFIRLGKRPTRIFDWTAPSHDPFSARLLTRGVDVTLACVGPIPTEIAIEAARLLKARGISIRILNFFCVKPIDVDAISSAAKETAGIVTIEDHNIIGGLGSAITEVVTGSCPCIVRRVGIEDKFVEHIGTEVEMLAACNVGAMQVVNAAISILNARSTSREPAYKLIEVIL